MARENLVQEIQSMIEFGKTFFLILNFFLILWFVGVLQRAPVVADNKLCFKMGAGCWR